MATRASRFCTGLDTHTHTLQPVSLLGGLFQSLFSEGKLVVVVYVARWQTAAETAEVCGGVSCLGPVAALLCSASPAISIHAWERSGCLGRLGCWDGMGGGVPHPGATRVPPRACVAVQHLETDGLAGPSPPPSGQTLVSHTLLGLSAQPTSWGWMLGGCLASRLCGGWALGSERKEDEPASSLGPLPRIARAISAASRPSRLPSLWLT